MKTRFSKVFACLFAGILTATAADWSVFAEQTSTLEYYVCIFMLFFNIHFASVL